MSLILDLPWLENSSNNMLKNVFKSNFFIILLIYLVKYMISRSNFRKTYSENFVGHILIWLRAMYLQIRKFVRDWMSAFRPQPHPSF